VESFAQFLYVSFVEAASLVQGFGYDAFRAKDWDQILLPEIMGIHQRAKDFYRGSIWDGMMLFFVCFNQGQQDRSILLLIIRWLDLLVSLSRADKYSSCWRADVIGVGKLNFKRVFFRSDFCHSFRRNQPASIGQGFSVILTFLNTARWRSLPR